MLRTQLLTPQQLKVSQELKHDKMRSKTSLSIKDQPLTFKNKVKSSGYTQQPRYGTAYSLVTSVLKVYYSYIIMTSYDTKETMTLEAL